MEILENDLVLMGSARSACSGPQKITPALDADGALQEPNKFM